MQSHPSPHSGFYFYPLQAGNNLRLNLTRFVIKLQRRSPVGYMLSASTRQYLNLKISEFVIKSQKSKKTCGILLSTMIILLITISNVYAQNPSTNAQPVERITILFEKGVFHLLSRNNF